MAAVISKDHIEQIIITHSGDIETERTPDFRRMERMPFPKPMIDNSNHNDVRVWRVKRGSKDRILIFSESAQYLVVLEDRGGLYFALDRILYRIFKQNKEAHKRI